VLSIHAARTHRGFSRPEPGQGAFHTSISSTATAAHDLREWIKAVQRARTAEIALTLRRGEETVEVTLAPGPRGIRAADRYDEPVFE
jgi:hypothetical protein